MAHGSAAAWGHLNLLGEYDFSEDKLQDSVEIKPPKLTDETKSRLGSSGIAENPLRPGSWQESCGTLRTFVGLTPCPAAISPVELFPLKIISFEERCDIGIGQEVTSGLHRFLCRIDRIWVTILDQDREDESRENHGPL